ncbi:MAG: hypothetical protein CVU77_04870 [Elusimicrobia bacterium HGW-Elusimicrobia-1]|jgi:NAD(P)H-nitrite reductase large subunit|nr:MAG: hypothetical protein CVU77_04870 [Elusimicrobia bacterium HGW-Elusimicrobia-1]
MNKKKSAEYLIIGAGPASAAAIESIRKIDGRGKIIVVSSEKDVFYSRPLISCLLALEIDKKHIVYRGRDFIEKNSLEIIAPAAVTSVDARGKSVRLSDGARIKWKKLIIASGGEAIVPENIAGAKGLRTFTSVEDARRIDADIKSGAKRAAVIGGGFIGLKCAEALVKRVLKVTLIELAPRVLPSLLDDVSAAVFTRNLTRRGIDVRTGARAEKISADGKKLFLADGSKISVDFTVAAAGVRPNISFLAGSGIRAAKGVIAGGDMRANFPDIFAAGDCAETPDFFSGEARPKARPAPIWPVARLSGAAAGANAAGGKVTAEGALSMNSVEVFGLAVISAGIVNPPDGSGLTVETAGLSDGASTGGPRYKKLIFDGDRLAGFIMLGDVLRAEIYTGLIRNRASVANCKKELSGDTFGFIAVGEENWKKRITPMEV